MRKNFIPQLSPSRHKGQSGRVGVLGGCFEYTGAPYVAAISAVKTGADLSFVFCSHDAATPIKSYGPELLVLPLLRTESELHLPYPFNYDKTIDQIMDWVSRLSSLVIGPGLGRDPHIQKMAGDVVRRCCQQGVGLVIDADGLFLLENDISLISEHKTNNIILTPNVNEFKRLYQKVLPDTPETPEITHSGLMRLSKKLGVIICQKGENDNICDGEEVLSCKTEGTLRRCGGIGDVLSGVMGCFLSWSINAQKNGVVLDEDKPNMSAAFAACDLTRRASKLAFDEHHRSMVAADIIPMIGKAFHEHYEYK